MKHFFDFSKLNQPNIKYSILTMIFALILYLTKSGEFFFIPILTIGAITFILCNSLAVRLDLSLKRCLWLSIGILEMSTLIPMIATLLSSKFREGAWVTSVMYCYKTIWCNGFPSIFLYLQAISLIGIIIFFISTLIKVKGWIRFTICIMVISLFSFILSFIYKIKMFLPPNSYNINIHSMSNFEVASYMFGMFAIYLLIPFFVLLFWQIGLKSKSVINNLDCTDNIGGCTSEQTKDNQTRPQTEIEKILKAKVHKAINKSVVKKVAIYFSSAVTLIAAIIFIMGYIQEQKRIEADIVYEEQRAIERENQTLRPTFKSFGDRVYMHDVVANTKIKERIMTQYSAEFYRKLVSIPKSVPMVRKDDYYECKSFDGYDEAYLRYYPETDNLVVDMKINNLTIKPSGEFDLGAWKLDYFENNFGEVDKDLPYLYIELYEKDNSNNRLRLRISNVENAWGLSFERSDDLFSIRSDKLNTLLVRDDSTGDVYTFNITSVSSIQYVAYITDDYEIQRLIQLLDNGNCTMSLDYSYALSNHKSIFKINHETKHIRDAFNLL